MLTNNKHACEIFLSTNRHKFLGNPLNPHWKLIPIQSAKGMYIVKMASAEEKAFFITHFT